MAIFIIFYYFLFIEYISEGEKIDPIDSNFPSPLRIGINRQCYKEDID